MSVELEAPQVATSSDKNAYDEIPYISFPYPQSHPNRLSVIAHLFGMQPKSISECRVLELGCASGGNLTPMAATLPRSQFVGIDSSARQVTAAQGSVESLGLENIDFQCRSILDITKDDGLFDYIICHGVYSWVPGDVRDQIMTVCSNNLAPQGVAYVSYNTYPGWRMRGTVRDMMVYHGRKFRTAQDQVRDGRALLDFLVKAIPEEKNPYGMFLRSEMELLRNKSDSYLVHEHLEHVNEPVYFHEFEGQASSKGLQYLGEADIGMMSIDGFGEQTSGIVRRIAADLIELEQYMDFLRNRMFRQTLLCHKDVAINRRQAAQKLRGLHVGSPVKPEVAVNTQSDDEAKFTGPLGSISTRSRLLKAALMALAEYWPQSIPFEQLLGQVQSQVYQDRVIDGARSQRDADSLGAALVDGFAKRCFEIYSEPPAIAAQAGERPLACALARQQALNSRAVTNLRHQLIELNDLGRHVVRLADGHRNRDELLTALVELVHQGALVVHAKTGTGNGSAEVKLVLAESLDQSLAQLARDAVLCVA